jgi:hypothetical protein
MHRPLRILAYPKRGGNAYITLLSARLEALGARVEDFSFARVVGEGEV